MNELTCNSICQLLCCPPVPSKIAAKLAFMPPPASYQLSPTESDGQCSFAFSPFLKHSFLHILPNNIEVTKAKTRKGNTIAILYMKTNPNTKLTFLLSHGNAVDLGLMVNFMHELGTKLNVNMMCYDYSGYGASSGKPLEKNLYADAECALDVLRTKFAVPLDQIVLYGQSIGTVPTVHLATLHRVAAVVLHSPLMSGLRVAFPRLKRNYCCDVFSNGKRAPNILSRTLIIHGTDDEVIHPINALRLYDLIPNALEPLFIRGAGHNNCELFEEYLIRLTYLVRVELELPNSSFILSRKSSSMASLLEDLQLSSRRVRRRRKIMPMTGYHGLPRHSKVTTRRAKTHRCIPYPASTSRSKSLGTRQGKSDCPTIDTDPGCDQQASVPSPVCSLNIASLSSESECSIKDRNFNESSKNASYTGSSTTDKKNSNDSDVTMSCKQSQPVKKRWLFWSRTN